MSIRRTIEGNSLILENTDNGDRVTIRETIDEDTAIIAPDGRLTAEMVHDLEDELTSLALVCRDMRIELGAVQYISNSVIRTLLEVQHMVDARQGTLRLTKAGDEVWNRFEEMGLEEVFDIARE